MLIRLLQQEFKTQQPRDNVIIFDCQAVPGKYNMVLSIPPTSSCELPTVISNHYRWQYQKNYILRLIKDKKEKVNSEYINSIKISTNILLFLSLN